MFDRYSIAKEIPLCPPFSKGDIFQAELSLLFEKACPEPFGCAQDKLRRREELGEIFDYSKRRRLMP
jgi:hypothetical protein